MLVIIDPISAALCKVPQPSFETLKAVLAVAVEIFKLESEAEMCRWEDDGGAPYDVSSSQPRARL